MQSMLGTIPRILASYDVGDFVALKPVTGGFTNENYLLETTKGKFLLKKYLRATSERVLREHRLLNWLQEKHFPVPTLMQTKQGTTFLEQENLHYAIQNYIEGETPVATNLVNENQLVSIAENLARYHWVSREIPLDIEPVIPIIDQGTILKLYEAVTTMLGEKNVYDDFDKMVASILPKKYEELRSLEFTPDMLTGLPTLLVHGDFHPANMKFNEHGEVTAVFDWELAKHQPRVWELLSAAQFVSKLGWTWNFHTPVDFARLKTFFQAYHKINPLLPEEVDAIPILLQAASADISWPLQEHYMLGNLQFDRFLPQEYDHWFFWNKNLENLRNNVLQEFREQRRLL